MPLTFRLARDHYGEPFTSEKHFVALSGRLVVGALKWQVLAGHAKGFEWRVHGIDLPPSIAPTSGFCATAKEAKSAIEASWRAWLEYAGVKEDPKAKPAPPIKR
jgi:hypothetical protein